MVINRHWATRSLQTTMLAVFALMLAACGGGIGDILGGGDSSSAKGMIEGTVERVDTRDRRIFVDVIRADRLDDVRVGNQVVLYYEDSTRVQYDGEYYEPANLEPGDEIRADVDEVNRDFEVREIVVTRNARDVLNDRDQDNRDDDYADLIRGEIEYVDTRQSLIEVYDERTRRTVDLRFDSRTRVDYAGRSYRPEDLQRGDEVEIRTITSGPDLLADQIDVVRSVSGDDSGSSIVREVEGTIRFLDDRNQTMELEDVSLDNGRRESTLRIMYDSRTVVRFRNQTYPVTNLERGDRVVVDVSERGRDWYADEVEVVVNSRDLRN